MTDLEITPFDVTEFLDTPERLAAFIMAALEEESDHTSRYTSIMQQVLHAHERFAEPTLDADDVRTGLRKELEQSKTLSLDLFIRILHFVGLGIRIVAAKAEPEHTGT